MVNSGPFDGERSPASIAKVAAWLGGGARRAGRHVPAARLADLAASGTGARRSRSCTARRAARSPVPDDELPVAAARRRRLPARGESRRWRVTPVVEGRVPDVRRRRASRHRHHGHVRRLLLVLLPLLLAGVRGRAVPREDIDHWMPADQYTGGVEHAILHLLYCRFFTKALYDFGLVGFTEPFPRLMNQGQVIYGGASMSKTRGTSSSRCRSSSDGDPTRCA